MEFVKRMTCFVEEEKFKHVCLFLYVFSLVQQELLVLRAAATTQRGPIKLPAEKDGVPTGNKPKSERWKAGKKKMVQARINTGLKRGQKGDGEDKTKGQGKENLPAKQPQGVSITS